MNRLVWFWVCLLCAQQVWAQTDTLVGVRAGSIELGAAGGWSAPMGDYGDLAELSWTGAVVLGYYPSPQLSLGIDLGGHWHGTTGPNRWSDADEPSSSFDPQSFPLYRIFTPYAKYQFKVAKVSPYVTGLVGLYLQEVKWTETTMGGAVTQNVSQGYLGWAAGFGLQMVTDDSILLFLEGRFHNAMRDGSAPIQFVDARAGVMFLL